MNKLYRERFTRNFGIMDERGLNMIKSTKIAIGGLGLGGSIFINLVRLGFEDFHIADPDIYERNNCNRQRLAKETTLGRRKDDCLFEEAKAINPDIKVKFFREGVKPHNVVNFLTGRDWVVDVVDLFAMPDKLALNNEAKRQRLPVASCASLGFMGAMVIFDNNGPSFAELSGISNQKSFEENCQNFLKFICPYIPSYMEEQLLRATDRSTHIPFVVPGVEISAAMAATEISKHVLGIGKKILAPEGIYFDPVNMKTGSFNASYQDRVLNIPIKKVA
jgi:molybdopterin/thiamine biosynthesis adenylyltransferase